MIFTIKQIINYLTKVKLKMNSLLTDNFKLLSLKDKEGMYTIFKIFINEMQDSDPLNATWENDTIKIKFLKEKSGFMYVLSNMKYLIACSASSEKVFLTETWVDKIRGNGKFRNDAVNIIGMICEYERIKCNSNSESEHFSFNNLAILEELKHWATYEVALYDISNKQNLSIIKKRVKYMEVITASEHFFEPITDILLLICSYINKNVIPHFDDHLCFCSIRENLSEYRYNLKQTIESGVLSLYHIFNTGIKGKLRGPITFMGVCKFLTNTETKELHINDAYLKQLVTSPIFTYYFPMGDGSVCKFTKCESDNDSKDDDGKDNLLCHLFEKITDDMIPEIKVTNEPSNKFISKYILIIELLYEILKFVSVIVEYEKYMGHFSVPYQRTISLMINVLNLQKKIYYTMGSVCEKLTSMKDMHNGIHMYNFTKKLMNSDEYVNKIVTNLTSFHFKSESYDAANEENNGIVYDPIECDFIQFMESYVSSLTQHIDQIYLCI